MIYVGIDDTDTLDTPGTNQLAKLIISRIADEYDAVSLVRHQLFFDPRVPYTSKNGSASIVLNPRPHAVLDELIPSVRECMREWFKEGSDPGLCVAFRTPAPAVTAFGRKCKTELVNQAEARAIAENHGIHLEGLGGTEGGVIGALAAVGLIVTGDDGRVVQLGRWPDDLSGLQEVATVCARGIQVRCEATGVDLDQGKVDVGKHLRPNLRGGQVVLFVRSIPENGDHHDHWEAVRHV